MGWGGTNSATRDINNQQYSRSTDSAILHVESGRYSGIVRVCTVEPAV